MVSRSRLVRSFLGRAGYDVTRLRDDAWLVQRPGAAGPRLSAHRIGRPKLGTHLVVDQAAARRAPYQHQKSLGNYLAGENLVWLLRELRIDCVLDVGANTGQFARQLRGLGFAGRIVSFEPVAHVLAELRAAAASDPDWLVMPYGLGEEDGPVEINVVPGTMSSLLDTSEFGRSWSDKLRESHKETIEVRRLDSVLDEATAGLAAPRVLLKLDTQGFDLQAFRGAGDRIKDVVALQSEVACVPIYDDMPRLPEQLTAYESEGFEITGMFPVSRHVPTLRVIEFDVVMVRPEAVGG